MAKSVALLLCVILLVSFADCSAVCRVTVSGTIDAIEGQNFEGVGPGDPYTLVIEYIPASVIERGISGPTSIHDFLDYFLQAHITIDAHTYLLPGTIQARIYQYFEPWGAWNDALEIRCWDGVGFPRAKIDLVLASWIGRGVIYTTSFDASAELLQHPWQIDLSAIETGEMRYQAFDGWVAIDQDLSAATANITFEGNVMPISSEPTSFGAIKSLYTRE
jgi:hypothetical protein